MKYIAVLNGATRFGADYLYLHLRLELNANTELTIGSNLMTTVFGRAAITFGIGPHSSLLLKSRHRAKFRGDRSNHLCDMAILRFFKDGGCQPS